MADENGSDRGEPGVVLTCPDADSLRFLLEWAPGALVVIGGDARILLLNAATAAMFGRDAGAMLGWGIDALLPQCRQDDFASCSQTKSFEMPARHADGHEFPVETCWRWLAAVPTALCLVSIADMSERQRVRQRLEDALREKTILLNELQHRVKNSLQVMISLLSLQADYAGDPRVRRILADSCSRVRAMALTHQLLYERNNLAQLDLGDYLERLVAALRATHCGSATHVALRLHIPRQSVQLDLGQAIPCGLLLNELVSNAYKHAFPGQRHGQIVIELREEAEDRIRFRVADNGIGLPPAGQLASCTTLGLQLVALFVEQLHGAMVITREGGTSFTVTFPKRLDKGLAP